MQNIFLKNNYYTTEKRKLSEHISFWTLIASKIYLNQKIESFLKAVNF